VDDEFGAAHLDKLLRDLGELRLVGEEPSRCRARAAPRRLALGVDVGGKGLVTRRLRIRCSRSRSRGRPAWR
jgi:hypothetical protein